MTSGTTLAGMKKIKNHSCVYILSNISNIVAHNKPEEEIAVIHPQ
jgi:hypothetical protein